MTISIQMILIVGVPFLLIYSALIFCYSYGKGYKEGLDLAREFAQVTNEFADTLEQIERKYAEPQESEDKG